MPEQPPWLWIIAGINGAGKTTLTRHAPVRALLGGGPVLNPDDLTDELVATDPSLPRNRANLEAARRTEAAVRTAIGQGRGIVVETVLSSDKYKPLIAFARERGFRIGLIYIALPSVELAIARVRTRVTAGGHDVPEDRIRSRWNRSLRNLGWFAGRADRLLVFSNHAPDHPPVLVADGTGGKVTVHAPDLLPEVTAVLVPLASLS